MRRWLRRLNLSPRSQRSIEEAALDWRHEVQAAPSFGAGLRSHLLGLVGLVTATGGAAIAETRLLRRTYWTLSIPLLMFLMVGVPWLISFDFAMLALPNVRLLGWLTLSLSATMALPSATFLAIAFANSDDPIPLLAIVGAMAAVSIAMLAGVIPASWQHYAEIGLLRPGLPAAAPYIYQAPALIARIAAAALLANSVRVDRHRWRLLLGALVFMALLSVADLARPIWRGIVPSEIFGYLSPLQTWLGLPLALAVRATRVLVDAFPLPLLTILLWCLLLRRQESTGYSVSRSSIEK